MWDTRKQKLRCFMTIDDRLGEHFGHAGVAYWRAFILEDRATGEVFGLYRFKHKDGSRNWIRLTPHGQGQAAAETLRCGLEDVINTAASSVGLPYRAECFYPPDDEGDPQKTIDWLLKYDLIHQPRLADDEPADGGV